MDARQHAQEVRAFVHDFNNLFMAIGGYCELLIEQSQPGSQTRADLLNIAAATERASALAQQLRAHTLQYAGAEVAEAGRRGSIDVGAG